MDERSHRAAGIPARPRAPGGRDVVPAVAPARGGAGAVGGPGRRRPRGSTRRTRPARCSRSDRGSGIGGGARHRAAAVERAARGGRLDPAQFLEIADTLDATARLATILADDRRPLLRELGARPACRCRRCAARWRAASIRSASCSTRRRPGWAACGRPSAWRTTGCGGAWTPLVGAELGSALQEPIVTLRNGRYVVPVKAEARSRVKGIVHDASGSGQTLFIEPLVAVELGNAWREAQVAEREEVERILDELSALVAANAHRAARDARRAGPVRPVGGQGAAWPPRWTASGPRRADRAEVVLLSARHPGLTGRVVPIDIRLGDGYTALVVTGPNTGGKTVTLRTLGLLSLMHQAGLHVPADGRQPPAGLARRLRRHRRRAVDRPVAVDLLRPPALDHAGSSRRAGPGTLVLLDELGRRHRSDRGLGAGPGAARPLHPGRGAGRGDDPLRRAQGLRPHDAGRPQRRGRVRPRDAVADVPADDRPARAAARRSPSPSAWGCPTPIVEDARSRLTETQRAFEATLAVDQGDGGRDRATALDRARAAESARGRCAARSPTRSGAGPGASATRRSRAARAEAERPRRRPARRSSAARAGRWNARP